MPTQNSDRAEQLCNDAGGSWIWDSQMCIGAQSQEDIAQEEQQNQQQQQQEQQQQQAATEAWQDLGWTGDAASSTGLENLLGQFFADPSSQMKFFSAYDPSKEQAATQQMQLGQQQAQEQARGSLWQQFEAGRQGKGGFGGGRRGMQAAISGIHKGLAQGREQAQLGLQQDISGLREGYRADVMGQIGSLLGTDVEAASNEQAACLQRGGRWANNLNNTGQPGCIG